MLAQIDADGYPAATTISPSRIDGIRGVTFCTGRDSNWVRRVKRCDRASVCFNSTAGPYNITLVCTLGVVDDPAAKREMWYDGIGSYFTGPEDPGFCVPRFDTLRYSLMLGKQDGIFRGTL